MANVIHHKILSEQQVPKIHLICALKDRLEVWGGGLQGWIQVNFLRAKHRN